MVNFRLLLEEFIEEYERFTSEERGNYFADVLSELMQNYNGISISDEERTSWVHTMGHIFPILCDINKKIPKAEVAFEYVIPSTADKKRVNMMICGYDAKNNPSVCIVEIKEWSNSMVYSVKNDDKEYVRLKGKKRPFVKRPSCQVLDYCKFLSDLELAKQRKVKFHPCVYLPNYRKNILEGFKDALYGLFVGKAPVFYEKEEELFKDFILSNISSGDNPNSVIDLFDTDTATDVTDSDIFQSILDNDDRINLSGDQERVCKRIMKRVRNTVDSSKVNSDGHRSVLVVNGEPGTGKTVIGLYVLMKALHDFIELDADSIRYITKTLPPRQFIEDLLDTSSDLNFNNRLMQMIKSPQQFIKEKRNGEFDLVIVDEAHRLTRVLKGLNPFEEIIKRSKVTVFLLDESQIVTHTDFGYMDNIKQVRLPDFDPSKDLAEEKLEYEFRCDREYMNFLYSILPSNSNGREINVVRREKKELPPIIKKLISRFTDGREKKDRYDFKVFSNTNELENALDEKKDASKVLVSGYVVPWFSKYKYNDEPVVEYDFIPKNVDANWGNFDDRIVDNQPRFNKKYNSADPKEGECKTWILRESAKDEVGCIHTVQGMSVDYIGVIIGDDLKYSSVNGLEIYTDKHPTIENVNNLIVEGVKQQIRDFANKKNLKYEEVLKDFRFHLNNSIDYALQGASPEEARKLILNTYRVLMSRGRKGCYVYCVNSALQLYLDNEWRNFRWN